MASQQTASDSTSEINAREISQVNEPLTNQSAASPTRDEVYSSMAELFEQMARKSRELNFLLDRIKKKLEFFTAKSRIFSSLFDNRTKYEDNSVPTPEETKSLIISQSRQAEIAEACKDNSSTGDEWSLQKEMNSEIANSMINSDEGKEASAARNLANWDSDDVMDSDDSWNFASLELATPTVLRKSLKKRREDSKRKRSQLTVAGNIDEQNVQNDNEKFTENSKYNKRIGRKRKANAARLVGYVAKKKSPLTNVEVDSDDMEFEEEMGNQNNVETHKSYFFEDQESDFDDRYNEEFDEEMRKPVDANMLEIVEKLTRHMEYPIDMFNYIMMLPTTFSVKQYDQDNILTDEEVQAITDEMKRRF